MSLRSNAHGSFISGRDSNRTRERLEDWCKDAMPREPESERPVNWPPPRAENLLTEIRHRTPEPEVEDDDEPGNPGMNEGQDGEQRPPSEDES